MPPGQNIANTTAARLDRAQQLLRGQLEALVRLAAIALRMIELGAGQVAVDPRRPLAGIGALERAVRGHARVSWALRLLWALRAKLIGDLARVERGEGVDEVLAAAEARPALAAQSRADSEADDDDDNDAELDAERGETLRETEGMERESFGRYLSGRSGEDEFAEILKRPTEDVIALIREALGLSPAQSEQPAGFQSEQGRPGRMARAVGPPPARPGSGLRSPCPL